MKGYSFVFGLLLFFLIIPESQAVIRKSDRMKPQWMQQTPVSSNSTYSFLMVYTDAGSDLNAARQMAKKELAASVERSEQVAVEEILDYESRSQGNNQQLKIADQNFYALRIYSQGVPVYIHFKRVDEYWEEVYVHGQRIFRLYTLYAVAKKGSTPVFDDIRFTTKYGARGVVRSAVIPGWGQFYKGNVTKGILFLGGEAALIAAAIASENMRSSYVKKAKEQPRNAQSYTSKADNAKNVRTMCFVGAGLLYVGGLVDALVADGRKRMILSRSSSFTMSPMVHPEYAGVSFAYQFK